MCGPWDCVFIIRAGWTSWTCTTGLIWKDLFAPRNMGFLTAFVKLLCCSWELRIYTLTVIFLPVKKISQGMFVFEPDFGKSCCVFSKGVGASCFPCLVTSVLPLSIPLSCFSGSCVTLFRDCATGEFVLFMVEADNMSRWLRDSSSAHFNSTWTFSTANDSRSCTWSRKNAESDFNLPWVF